jgi:hypothetical protein
MAAVARSHVVVMALADVESKSILSLHIHEGYRTTISIPRKFLQEQRMNPMTREQRLEEFERACEPLLKWKEELDAKHLLATLPDGCVCELCQAVRKAADEAEVRER